MSDEPHGDVHTHADGTTHAHPHTAEEHDHVEHEHQHTHPDGTTHAHPHTHEHGDEEDHAHAHEA